MAALHPQIVHFTIVLVIIGVAFRIVSLFGRPAFAGPAAATVLILAAASRCCPCGRVRRRTVPSSGPRARGLPSWSTRNGASARRRCC